MCLISGDSIVGAAPSPKLSPRPGRRASGPARKSRQPRPKPLCLRVCFLRDRQSSTTTLLKSSVLCHKCVLPTCNTIQPSMAAADLQSNSGVSATTLGGLGRIRRLDFDLPSAYHRDPSSNTHESVHSQPRSQEVRIVVVVAAYILHSASTFRAVAHTNASPRLLRKRPRGRQLPTDGGGTLPRDQGTWT
jgi:hypothetical protein